MQVRLGACLLVVVMALSGCSTTKEVSSGTSEEAGNGGVTKLVFWTFVDAHQKFYESMASSENQAILIDLNNRHRDSTLDERINVIFD